jgi:hypothetical protein
MMSRREFYGVVLSEGSVKIVIWIILVMNKGLGSNCKRWVCRFALKDWIGVFETIMAIAIF